jgi:ATPase subunit of ABC transporter with duplicated ATPase domains
MIHKPIQIKNLSLFFAQKICFENFTAQINYGNRIAIIGQNGSGKSTLLKILYGIFETTNGEVKIPDEVIFGYVPQVIQDFDSLSGGERLNTALTQALSLSPNVLLLDEPTNHLDRQNRKGLMKIIESYSGTLVIVSHDTELLRDITHTLWHIDNKIIKIFSGNYDDYIFERCSKRAEIAKKISLLNRQKKDTHYDLMKEQQRAAKSKTKGEKNIEKRKWPTIVSKSKALRAEQTSGRKKSAIEDKKQHLKNQLADLNLPKILIPNFSLNSAEIGNRNLLSINEASVGYQNKAPIINKINLCLSSTDRIAIAGNNGAGKSTMIKAVLGNPEIIRNGYWHIPKQEDIGYLDQHYNTLSDDKSVFESISELVPYWSNLDIRSHLSHFLFRKNEEVNALVSQLSGGEKSRLSLAQIGAKTPRLLILDEITNNLDLETQEHVIEVLYSYPGAIIVISHDEDFLRKINVKDTYIIKDCTIEYQFFKDNIA